MKKDEADVELEAMKMIMPPKAEAEGPKVLFFLFCRSQPRSVVSLKSKRKRRSKSSALSNASRIIKIPCCFWSGESELVPFYIGLGPFPLEWLPVTEVPVTRVPSFGRGGRGGIGVGVGLCIEEIR